MNNKISVIVPAYNAEKDLPNLIIALKRQTIKPLEYILVDDCSTDKTKEIAKEFLSRN